MDEKVDGEKYVRILTVQTVIILWFRRSRTIRNCLQSGRSKGLKVNGPIG